MTLLLGYAHADGRHCASSAMRDLLRHHCGLALSEAMVFGLGAGCTFLCTDVESMFFVTGRAQTFEVDLARLLGLDYAEETDADDAHAWEAARDVVVRARTPVLLTGDTFYLPYSRSPTHFPGHRFVLVGFDGPDTALVVERNQPAPIPVLRAQLALARNCPIAPYCAENCWGYFRSGAVRHTVHDAGLAALRLMADRMLQGRDDSPRIQQYVDAGIVHAGVGGIRVFRHTLQQWRTTLPPAEVARRCERTHALVEKLGSGGGLFRFLLADFLAEMAALAPRTVKRAWAAGARASAEAWTALATALLNSNDAKVNSNAEDRVWQECDRLLGTIAATEEALFADIATTLAAGSSRL